MSWTDFHIEYTDPYEDSSAIVYLDTDPLLAAQYAIDRDVRRMITVAVQHLSNAWHVAAPEYTMVDFVDPAKGKEPADHNDRWMRAEVLHQRIKAAHDVDNVTSQWVRASGGNYWWTWRWLMNLILVWRGKTVAPHEMEYMAYTLEVVPPALLESINTVTEPPITMPVEYRVTTPDGLYVEAVDSWRRYYVRRRQNVLVWGGRKPPPWLELVDGKYLLVKQAG